MTVSALNYSKFDMVIGGIWVATLGSGIYSAVKAIGELGRAENPMAAWESKKVIAIESASVAGAGLALVELAQKVNLIALGAWAPVVRVLSYISTAVGSTYKAIDHHDHFGRAEGKRVKATIMMDVAGQVMTVVYAALEVVALLFSAPLLSTLAALCLVISTVLVFGAAIDKGKIVQRQLDAQAA